jgi:uncharacterized MAPEG superfamily protein
MAWMTRDLLFVAYSAALTWLMLLTASLLRAPAWTLHGMTFAFGNRDRPPEPNPLAGRAHRASRNMLENFVLFAALVLAARVGGVPSERLVPGAAIFFWARVVYFGVYLAGIAYARTAVWAVSVVGLGMILATMMPG